MQRIDRQRMRAEEALLHRVQRRRADIAVDDPDRAEHQLRQRFLGPVVRRRRRPASAMSAVCVAMRADVGFTRIKILCGFRYGAVRNSPNRRPPLDARRSRGAPSAHGKLRVSRIRSRQPPRLMPSALLMVAVSTAARPVDRAALGQFRGRPALPAGRTRARGPCGARRGAGRRRRLGACLQFLLHRPAPHLPHPQRQRRRHRRVLFLVAVVTSHLAASVRKQAQIAAAHAARNATIAGLARSLLSCTTSRKSPMSASGSWRNCSIAMRSWSAVSPSRASRRRARLRPA